ncbi:MAG: hypothetical protein BGO69_11935 [Bacteroidetes bacterium 46-16]|nr:MAG: hypothetical protein BGO69_11935 [Bacteroidetes bacterium 46-16]
MSEEIFIWDLETAKTEHQFSPKLADALVGILPADKMVLDFGCGKGSYLARLAQLGFKCIGYEGTDGIHEIADFHNIQEGIDLSKPLDVAPLNGSVLCLEVAEHIPKQYESVFLDNITGPADALLVLSWALPGQGGCGHHNEQSAEYVINTIEDRGFRYIPDSTTQLRTAGGSELWWFRKSIYVFKKAEV